MVGLIIIALISEAEEKESAEAERKEKENVNFGLTRYGRKDEYFANSKHFEVTI